MDSRIRFWWVTGLALTLSGLLFSPQSFAQAINPTQGTPESKAPATADSGQAAKPFSQQELDQMLAPVALYPDPLLSQMLMASTYPLEVVMAARWSRDHPGLNGSAAVQAAESSDWDPSVKSLVAFPQVLSTMDEKIEWTERLGEAFQGQQAQVMETVQALRKKAEAAGNLKSSEQIAVSQSDHAIAVEPASPEIVYVPYYDPWVAYGPWWWAGYPPVFWGPWPGYAYYPARGYGAWVWGVGISVGVGFFYGGFDWHHHYAYLGRPNFYYPGPPHGYHPPPGAPIAWRHDPGHRRDVPWTRAGPEPGVGSPRGFVRGPGGFRNGGGRQSFGGRGSGGHAGGGFRSSGWQRDWSPGGDLRSHGFAGIGHGANAHYYGGHMSGGRIGGFGHSRRG